MCFPDIKLKTVAKLYGCVSECFLAPVLQTEASKKGSSDLLSVSPALLIMLPRAAGISISLRLSAVDSGEEKVHVETSSHSYKHSEQPWRRPDGAERALLDCAGSYSELFSPLLYLWCEGAVSAVLTEAGGTVEGALSYDRGSELISWLLWKLLYFLGPSHPHRCRPPFLSQ